MKLLSTKCLNVKNKTDKMQNYTDCIFKNLYLDYSVCKGKNCKKLPVY